MEQKQVPIVCDTNIWYYLSDGTIDPKQVAGKQLVSTFVSAYEFCCTNYALYDYNKLRNAVIAYKHYPKKTYPEAPPEYIKMISNHKSVIPKWAEISRALNNVVRVEHYVASDQARAEYVKFNVETKKSLEPFEEVIDEHRRQIEFRGVHKKAMDLSASRFAHKEITKQLLTNLSGGVLLDWVRLDLFLNTFDEWIRQLSIQPTLKMNANDWNDVLNLVYVQPGSLYWTEDKRKTKEFIRECGCGHYLYLLD